MRRWMAWALVVLVAACANEDDEEQRDQAVQGDSLYTSDLSDAEVASLLRYIDGSEIGTARQFMPRLTTADARAYAQLLIDDHTRLREVAAERTEHDDATEPPPQFRLLREVTKSQSAMLMTLPSGPSYDATFLGVQAANHAMVLDSLRAWRNTVEEEGLRATIDAALPVIEQHRERALAAFRSLQLDDPTPLRPPTVRVDSAGPRHTTPGLAPPDAAARRPSPDSARPAPGTVLTPDTT